MIKTAKHHLEECKIGIRNHRRDAIEKVNALAKDKAVGEDDAKRARDEIQKIHDDEIKSADRIFQQKEKELLEI
jgi:ribosome recycling factor